MKRTLLAAILMLAAISVSGKENINGNDSRITYIGRSASVEGTTKFDWSGVTMIVEFEGTSLTINGVDKASNSFNVWIDKNPSATNDKVLNLNGTNVIAKGLPKGRHTVILQKRTEGEQGLTTIESLATDGKFLQARPLKQRRIEFVGDSYTCGYGTESAGRDEPFRAEEENCNLAYAEIIGRFFDADVQLVSHSGRGIARNYGGFRGETMPELYMRTFNCAKGEEWNDGSFDPAIVVIYLGTNDFSTEQQPMFNAWYRQYSKLLDEIRRNYPEVPILCVASKADALLGNFVEQTVKLTALENVYWTSIQDMAHNDTTELGASWHPNYEGQRKVAGLMIPYISTITGWEMPYKPVE